MSRWGKPTKNRKHRDPRYFLNENVELEERYEQLADDGALRDAERLDAMIQLAKRLGVKDSAVIINWVDSPLSPEQIEQRWKAGYRGEFRDLDEAVPRYKGGEDRGDFLGASPEEEEEELEMAKMGGEARQYLRDKDQYTDPAISDLGKPGVPGRDRRVAATLKKYIERRDALNKTIEQLEAQLKRSGSGPYTPGE
jgi:hypothetical protein